METVTIVCCSITVGNSLIYLEGRCFFVAIDGTLFWHIAVTNPLIRLNQDLNSSYGYVIIIKAFLSG